MPKNVSIGGRTANTRETPIRGGVDVPPHRGANAPWSRAGEGGGGGDDGAERNDDQRDRAIKQAAESEKISL